MIPGCTHPDAHRYVAGLFCPACDEYLPETEYPYAHPDLNEWLKGRDVMTVTLEEVFQAGERCGADLERGSLFQSLPDSAAEAEEEGRNLVDYLRGHLLHTAEQEKP